MKIIFLLILFFRFCSAQPVLKNPSPGDRIPPSADSLLFQRFAPPAGFQRKTASTGSFAYYLRNLPLKPPGSKVLLHDGREKRNSHVHAAVVNLPIGKKDLHQCADAVIRLRAEYLWKSKQFDQIRFHLTNGFLVDYNRWRSGGRVKVTGNQTEWVQTARPSDSYATFWQYLEFVFSYAGTLSLSKELISQPFAALQIGDVFIQGGSPGHAVIVVDMAVDASGKKAFLLAQSYMPAQEIQILKNPAYPNGDVWYLQDAESGQLETPEWVFRKSDLKRF